MGEKTTSLWPETGTPVLGGWKPDNNLLFHGISPLRGMGSRDGSQGGGLGGWVLIIPPFSLVINKRAVKTNTTRERQTGRKAPGFFMASGRSVTDDGGNAADSTDLVSAPPPACTPPPSPQFLLKNRHRPALEERLELLTSNAFEVTLS